MTLNKILLFTITVFALVSCKPKFDVPDADKGNIDASNYVALGGAMTAGYSNGGLYYKAQQNSYVYLLAEQLKLVGGGDFKVPYVSESSIGIGSNNNNAPSILGNRTDCQGTVSLGPVKLALQGDLSVFASNVYSSQGPFNNLGVPDVKVIDMDVSSYNNPFYVRMASSASSSILSDAVAKNPTFFTVALGLNDVLNFTLKGGTSDAITPVAGAVNVGFEASINNVIDKLTANGSKGVIANIPSFKSMAYFNTIAWNALKLDTTTAFNLTNFYVNLDSTKFHTGNNGFMIEDSNNQFLGFRQAVQGEYILLNAPLDSIKCFKWGSLIPIPNRYSLTMAEVDSIENAINSYNVILRNLAEAKGLAFVDMNTFFTKIRAGFMYNGVAVSAAFVSGGAYSLDGLNLTPRGNALLANEFIKAINETYQAAIPQIEAIKYPGVIFP
jgi:lysophospholipase L1-like esterase